MAVRVRAATVADAAAIAEVNVVSWQATYAHALPAEFLAALSVSDYEARWQNNLANPAVTVCVAVNEDRVVGYAVVSASRDEDVVGDRVGELQAIYAHPDCWDTGVGSRLHEHVVDALSELGFCEATVWVLEQNDRARRFYERHSWVADGESKHDDRGGTTIVEVRYRRALGHA
jgi:GNAT superfamily N-acetyltransferase